MVGYLAFQTSMVQTFIVRQITNQLSEKLHTNISIKSVDIAFFNKVILNDVLIEDQKADTMLFVGKLVASIDQLKIKKKTVNLSSLALLDMNVNVSLDKNRIPNYQFLVDAFSTEEKPAEAPAWNITCRNFVFEDTSLGYSYYQNEDVHLIHLQNIHLDINNLQILPDSISFRINHLGFDDQNSFTLNELSTNIVFNKDIISLSELKVSTPNSNISDANFSIDLSARAKGKDFSYSEIDLDIQESLIDMRDVAELVPDLKGMNLRVNLSGHIFGKIADLKAKNLSVGFGERTKLTCDFYINGLPNLEEAYMYLDLKKSSADFKDFAQIRLPDKSAQKYPDIPSFLSDAGIIQYQGNFTGFISDFVAYGTVRSNFGRLDTDLSFAPTDDNSLAINGHLKTTNFKLGEFAKIKDLGALTFNGQINGTYNKAGKKFAANINGVIDSMLYNSYEYKKIVLDGQIQEQKFEGDLKIDDSNLKGRFAGKVDLNPEIPIFDFELQLDHANLVALNIDKKHLESDLSIDLRANFSGNSIDNINGSIWFEEGLYSNENNFFLLNSLTINTFKDSVKNLTLRSDFLDADIRGSYSFQTLGQGLKNLAYHFVPASGLDYSATPGLNKFNLDINIKDAEPITQTFFPNLYISPAKIFCQFDESRNKLDIYSELPRIEFNKLVLKNYSFSLHTNETLELKNRVEEFQLGEDLKLYNLSLISEAKANNLNSKLIWNNYDITTYSGELETEVDFTRIDDKWTHVDMDILPSKIYIADTLWSIYPAKIIIDSTRVEVKDFKIANGDQSFAFDGAISKDKAERMNMTVSNFRLDNLNLLVGDKNHLQGQLNGTASIFDAYEKALFLSDLQIKGLNYSGQDIGDISLLSKWDRSSESIQTELVATRDSQQTVYGYGNYSPSRDSLDFTINADKLPLTVLRPVLENTFDDVHGEATGELKIYGKPEKIMMWGDIYGEDAGLTLGALQVGYSFSDTVKFRGDSLIFDHVNIKDMEGNPGIFDGSIRHDNFGNMDYNMTLSSRKILALNTTIRDNERFYGKAYGDGFLQITGHGQNVRLDGTAKTLSGTIINISLDYESEAQVYDFIQFINTKEDEVIKPERRLPQQKSQLFMKFNIDATPDARFQLIYNSQIGDLIKAQGTGSMQIEIDPDFNISMYGDYRVEKGDYLFTLQNVINKKFEIEQGGTINWSGDPYNAEININAIYKLKASLNELFANSVDNIGYNQRIPVSCKIALTENLNNPKIGFNIDFPSTEERIKDEVKQFFNTEEDMNKQMLSLLVLGRFYTPEYQRGSYEASNPNLVGTTASELFSNQLSNWLSQISNDFDIGINYRPGDQISNDEIELAMSTQIFNDRVTLNGNIGNNGQTTTANNNNIVGDFDLNVKLTNNGKLQFKAYNHSNNNIIYETSPYTQGIGLSYRENYDYFSELWQKFVNIFRKKEARK